MTATPAAAPAADRQAGLETRSAPRWRRRRYGRVNWAGVWALTRRGVRAFMTDAVAYLCGPLVTAGLFLAVFVLAIDGGSGDSGAVRALTDFVAPGIAAFMMVHHAFQHAAAMLVMDKTEGVIQDFLMAPLSPLEVMAGYVLSALATALMIGALILLMMMLAAGLAIERPLALLGFAFLGALLFSLIGTLVGLWAEKWEQYSAAESFLILPLGVLSGAFFEIEALAESWRWAIAANPFHYVVDGMRWSAIETATGSPLLAAAVVALLSLLLGAAAWRLFAVGYHIKP